MALGNKHQLWTSSFIMQPAPLPQQIALQPYLSLDELERRYRRAKVPVERSQFQIIWLVAQGKSVEEVAALTGHNYPWVYQLIWRYNQHGAKALTDKWHNKRGWLFMRIGV